MKKYSRLSRKTPLKTKTPLRRTSTLGQKTRKAGNGSGAIGQSLKSEAQETTHGKPKVSTGWPLSRKKPFPRVSKKRRSEGKVYSEKRTVFLTLHPICQVCKKEPSTQIHHKKGRGKYYLDETSFLASCADCHHRIETEKAWARESGYTIYGKDGK